MAPSAVMVIDRGDIPSLAACAIQNERQQTVLWHLIEPDAAAQRRRAAVQAHAEAWGISEVITSTAVELGVPGMAPPQNLFKAAMLLQALTAASQISCRRLVWPEQAGPDGEAVALAVDRASAIAALGELSSEGPQITIELPLVDLSDVQILELAEATGAPLGAAWPCDHAGAAACASCPGCVRWAAAFDELHLQWPWPAAAAQVGEAALFRQATGAAAP